VPRFVKLPGRCHVYKLPISTEQIVISVIADLNLETVETNGPSNCAERTSRLASELLGFDLGWLR
jgi:hypothetical protein